MNFESRSIKASCHISANCCLAFEYGLARKNEHSIIAPIGEDLFDILSREGEVGPLSVPA
jgi:hypothetical protein